MTNAIFTSNLSLGDIFIKKAKLIPPAMDGKVVFRTDAMSLREGICWYTMLIFCWQD